MNKSQFNKYFEGKASNEEKQELLTHVRESDENLNTFNQAKDEWKETGEKSISLSTWHAWKQLETKISSEFTISKKLGMSIVSSAASLILLLGLSLFFLAEKSQDQSLIVKSEQGQLTEVYLPDSTMVILNSASQIAYNTKWFGLQRIVKLNGEAFFNVSTKKNSTFDVFANGLKVHVTGTQFNVKAYEDEPAYVVLKEGSVELSKEDNSKSTIYMKPGELFVYDDHKNKFRKGKVEVSDYTSWTKGIVYFENNPLPDLIKVLERRYGVEFNQIDDPTLREFTLTLTIRDESIEKIMELITATLPVNINTNNKIITISLNKDKYENMN